MGLEFQCICKTLAKCTKFRAVTALYSKYIALETSENRKEHVHKYVTQYTPHT